MKTKTWIAALLACAASARGDVRIEAVPGQAEFKFKHSKVTDFSGITWLRGDDFYVVANKEQALFPLKLELDSKGAIVSAKLGARIPVKTPLDDFEGIAYWPGRDRLYVSTEKPPGIVGFDLRGDARFSVTVPKIFSRALKNKGLESLTRGAGAFWTANEDALAPDGNPSSARQGALIRLQKFNERFEPAGQFAYRTEPSLLRSGNTGTGVTDLAALPGGELLVLERVVGLGLFAKIFQAKLDGATDTSALASLQRKEITPVAKKLLFERATGGKNFEGIALGPELEDGWRSLILIEDSGGDDQHSLMPLRIKLSAEEAAPSR